MKANLYSTAAFIMIVMFAVTRTYGQVTLNQELCEITKKYVKGQKIEFTCSFTLTNQGASSITISDGENGNFQKPCECTSIKLVSKSAQTVGQYRSQTVKPGETASFDVIYTLDGKAESNTDDGRTYTAHLAEFKESGGMRNQTIELNIKETNQSFNLEFIYYLEGYK
jgi:hypothetical protein